MIEPKDGAHDSYRRKIKTREQLRQIIGPRPRDRKVIMCHGAFDLVHPGHLRHLMYAKSKGDVLVASLTSDAYISKANYRPFIPQQLRAMNLAALEIVDYVIIDEQPTPLENLTFLEPDYFAKGYEYTGRGVHPKTQKEIDVLGAYGGEIIFTPGDLVFSSSRFIESEPPKIGVEKLLALMEAEAVTFSALRETLDKCRGLRVHVVGDTIVDSYVYCTPIGSSAGKTPTLSVQVRGAGRLRGRRSRRFRRSSATTHRGTSCSPRWRSTASGACPSSIPRGRRRKRRRILPPATGC